MFIYVLHKNHIYLQTLIHSKIYTIIKYYSAFVIIITKQREIAPCLLLAYCSQIYYLCVVIRIVAVRVCWQIDTFITLDSQQHAGNFEIVIIKMCQDK